MESGLWKRLLALAIRTWFSCCWMQGQARSQVRRLMCSPRALCTVVLHGCLAAALSSACAPAHTAAQVRQRSLEPSTQPRC
jgi:hypothetical protein